MSYYQSRYRITRPGRVGCVSVGASERDPLNDLFLGFLRRQPLAYAPLPVGSRATVEHHGTGVTYSVTSYRRVKAGWRVVRPGRLGGLRWRRKGARR